MDDGNLAVLVDAKTEYTKQLVNILRFSVYHIIQNLFLESKLECEKDNNQTKILYTFQKKLSEIPKWNSDIIKKECETIIENSKCDWIDELITAVFVSHTRILTSINFNKSKGKIDLNIPKTEHFIHKCFIDVARYFWKNSYLFDDRVTKYEFQKHRREAELLIEQSINETIRKELPVKNILKKYLGNDYTDLEDDDEEDEDFNEYISKKQKKNLRKMVMKEIENCSQEKLDKLKLVLEGKKGTIEDTEFKETVKSNYEETTPFSVDENLKLEETFIINSKDEIKKEINDALSNPKESIEAKVSPVEAKVVPIEAKVLPVESKAEPVEAKVLPVEAKAVPVEANVLPVEAKEDSTKIVEINLENTNLDLPKDNSKSLELCNVNIDEPLSLNTDLQDEIKFFNKDNMNINLDKELQSSKNLKDKELIKVKKIENEIDNLIDTNIVVEELNLDNFSLNEPKKNTFSNNTITLLDDNVIDTNNSEEEVKKNIVNKYSKNRNYTFFE